MKVETATPVPAPDQAQAVEAAAGFEAILTRMVLAEMRRAAPGDPLLGGSDGFALARDMFDAEVAERIAERGWLDLARGIAGAGGRR